MIRDDLEEPKARLSKSQVKEKVLANLTAFDRFPKDRLDQRGRVWCVQRRGYSHVAPNTIETVNKRVVLVLQLFDKVKKPDEVTMESHIINDLGLDSLDHIEIIMAMEDEFREFHSWFQVTMESHIINDLGLDSLDHIEIIMAMEDEFREFHSWFQVTMESHIINDLGLDSLDHIEIIMAVEDEFREFHSWFQVTMESHIINDLGLDSLDHIEIIMAMEDEFREFHSWFQVTMESHIINDLGLDSLDHIEIIMAMEDEFQIEIPDGDAERLLTPALIAQYVCDHDEIYE